MPLDLPGLVVQEDPDEHKDSTSGAEDSDLVTEHNDAQPNRQGVFDSTGNTEGNWGNPSHESIGSDTLQVEQGAVENQQQDNVLTPDEAPPTLPNQWDVQEEHPGRYKHDDGCCTGIELQFWRAEPVCVST